jgi:hypothetical protein
MSGGSPLLAISSPGDEVSHPICYCLRRVLWVRGRASENFSRSTLFFSPPFVVRFEAMISHSYQNSFEQKPGLLVDWNAGTRM